MILEEENIYFDTKNTKYKNIREYFDTSDFLYTHYTFMYKGDDVRNFVDFMPFYYKDGRFDNYIQYYDLPFTEYEDYGFCDYNMATGIGGDIPPIPFDEVLIIYHAINNFAKENPLALTLLNLAFGAIKYLLKKLNLKDHILELIKFCKRKNIKLDTSKITNDSNLTNEEEEEINKGLSLLQELLDKGYIDKAIDEYYKDGRRK